MKNVVMIFMVAVFSLVCAGNSFAAHCNDKGCKAQINRLYTTSHGEGRVYIELKDVDPSEANCTPAEGKYFTLYSQNNMFHYINAQLQASAIMGKEVWVRINEGTNPCEVNYIQTWY